MSSASEPPQQQHQQEERFMRPPPGAGNLKPRVGARYQAVIPPMAPPSQKDNSRFRGTPLVVNDEADPRPGTKRPASSLDEEQLIAHHAESFAKKKAPRTSEPRPPADANVNGAGAGSSGDASGAGVGSGDANGAGVGSGDASGAGTDNDAQS